MALGTPTHVTDNVASGAVVATSGIAVSAGDTLVVTVANDTTVSGPTNGLGDSDGGLTWTKAAERDNSQTGTNPLISCFVTKVPYDIGSLVITATCSDGSCTASSISVEKITGADTVYSNGAVNSSGTGDFTVTLGGSPAADSITIYGYCSVINSAFASASGFTSLALFNNSSTGPQTSVGYDDTTPGTSVTIDGAGRSAGYLIEIKAAAVTPSLTPDDGGHAHSAEQASLGAASTLAPVEASHGHNADSPSLGPVFALSPADAAHGHSADQTTVSAASALSIDDAGHAHSADQVSLGAGTAPTTMPTSPDVHYHPASQSASLDGSDQVLSCPDLMGLAALSGTAYGGGTVGPVEMTDALGRRFWRFTGGQYLLVNNALASLSARGVTVFAVVRKHNHKNAITDFFSPRYSAYSDDTTNTAYSGGSTMRTTFAASNAGNFLFGAGIGAHTDGTNGYKIMPGCQICVIGVASRTTANGGQRLYVNEDVASVAQSGVTSSSCTGGVIGGRPAASNAVTSGAGEYFDLYELAVWKGELTNGQADAIAAAMVANWQIEAITRQLVLDGDSITDGIPTNLPVSPKSGDNLGMVLTEPGAGYVPADMRVMNAGTSGNQTSNIVTRRDVTNGVYAMLMPGGAANNIVAFQIGRNDVAPSQGNKNSADLYGDVTALINTTTTGLLQRGWKVHVVANIATTDTPTTTNNLPGETGQMQRLANYRDLIADTASHLPQGQFLTDCLANTGQTYEGLLDVLHLYDVTVSGDTKFKTATDAADTGSGYYDDDLTHLTVEGIALMATGGDTPDYGYGSLISMVPLLTVAGAAHGHSADQVTLGAASTLAPAGAVHGHVADSPSLTVASTLMVAEAVHGHGAESPSLSVSYTLTPGDASHGHAAEAVALSVQGVLTVADATHGQSAEQPGLSVSAALSIGGAIHAHMADAASVQVQGQLSVAGAAHGHSAGVPAFVFTARPRRTAIPGGRGMTAYGRPTQPVFRRPPNISR